MFFFVKILPKLVLFNGICRKLNKTTEKKSEVDLLHKILW